MHGGHVIRSWSRMLNLVAVSFAEAELYGTVRVSSARLGCRSMAGDIRFHLSGRSYADASAALGIIHRQGLGKLRHIDTISLWLQQAARQKLIAFTKVDGTHNPADIATKHLAAELRLRHTTTCGIEYLEGRAAIAPEVSPDQINAVDAEQQQKSKATKVHWEAHRGSWADIADSEDEEDIQGHQ